VTSLANSSPENLPSQTTAVRIMPPDTVSYRTTPPTCLIAAAAVCRARTRSPSYASQPNPAPHTTISTSIVRRLNCSQRRRGFGVDGRVVVMSGILESTLDSTAPPPTLVEMAGADWTSWSHSG